MTITIHLRLTLYTAVLLCYINIASAQTDNDTIDYTIAPVTNADIATLGILNMGDDSVYSNPDSLVARYLKLEVIDKKLFDRKQKTAVNFIVPNKKIVKTNGVITLPCRNKAIQFSDEPSDEETHAIFEFSGEIPALNSYFVEATFYEEYNNFFIDKTTAEITAFGGGFPFISPDKKHIISLSYNVYDMVSELSLYNINKDGISSILFASFVRWMPLTEDPVAFYAKDGYLYVAVNPMYGPPDTQRTADNVIQYIRIRVL